MNFVNFNVDIRSDTDPDSNIVVYMSTPDLQQTPPKKICIFAFLFDFWGGRSHRRSRRGDVQDVSVCGGRPRADVYFEQWFVLALCTI